MFHVKWKGRTNVNPHNFKARQVRGVLSYPRNNSLLFSLQLNEWDFTHVMESNVLEAFYQFKVN